MERSLTKIGRPVPELPVADVDATYAEPRASGANIVDPIADKPWGLRQFTVEDQDRNRFYVHCDNPPR